MTAAFQVLDGHSLRSRSRPVCTTDASRQRLVLLLAGFVAVTLRIGAIFLGRPPVLAGRVAVQAAAAAVLRFCSPLMALRHLLIELRCSLRGCAAAR